MKIADGRCRGAVLLEVVLALALFVGVAAVLTSGMNSAMRNIERLRWQAHAADRAATVLAELQLGLRTLDNSIAGAQPFEAPFEDWSFEISSSAPEEAVPDSPIRNVEVVVRHTAGTAAYRISQTLFMPAAERSAPNEFVARR